MQNSPRYLAIAILCQWQQARHPLDLLMEPCLQQVTDPRDRNLLKAMVFGTLRELGAVDWILGRLSSTPLSRLKPAILQTLRIGAYQLLFLERVPVPAAIHATVEAVKARGEPQWLVGFVNGVLRNVGRRRQEFLALLEAGEAPEEAVFNHPAWLLNRWRDRYQGLGMAAICRSNNAPARLCLRVNTSKIAVPDFITALAAQQIHTEPGRYLPEAVWLEPTGAIADLPGYDEGWFFVQDELAQLIVHMMLPCPPGNCLDGCAGLGGKTATLATIVPEGVTVVAVEPEARRQRLFLENMARLGLSSTTLFHGTIGDYAAKTMDTFASVLIDAPCSGLGVTGRHPDIRWQRTERELLAFQEKQVQILLEASPLVSSGGVLVYATCSTEPEENEAVVTKFQEANPLFVIESAVATLPGLARQLVNENGFLRTIPGIHGGSDGFFAARFRRKV
jgi:16S rRNA (cytosine967-C5)-methyltransferase